MKRTKYIFTFFCVLLLMLGLRLYYLMITQGDAYEEMALTQTTTQLQLGGGRGNIYDRNMLSFTSVGKKKVAVVVKGEDTQADFDLCGILDKENVYSLYNRLYKKEIVYVDLPWNFNPDLIGAYKNVCVIEDTKRYPDDGSGASVIGYLSDGEGVSGLELACNNLLKNGDSYSLQVSKDAAGHLLPGFSFDKQANESALILKTTLDKKYTEICQEALKGINGSAVLIEIPSFDLIAMASSPTYNQNKIENYLDDPEKPLLNRATAGFDMGSIFKIVVSAAAIESGSVDLNDVYSCNGLKEISGVTFLCNNHASMENMTMEDAFIHSCNAVFIDIGLKTGYNNIINMAEAFGLQENLIYPQEFPQNPGVLPDAENYYLADVANVSIGQGKLLGTAVHGAVLSAVVANNGVRDCVNVADCLMDENQLKKVSLRTSSPKRVFSTRTAEIIRDMMIKTVQEGTGKAARSSLVECAGKTGSAQTGRIINDEECVHAWFTGFFPVNNPKYALCVFVENGKSGGSAAAPIFKTIAEKISVLEGW